MENIRVPFGKEWLDFQAPSESLTGVLWPHEVPALADPDAEIRRVLDEPLGGTRISDLLHPCDKVLIIIDDYTRTTPVQRILPHLLERIHACDVPVENVTLLVATGTHRPCTPEELLAKLGQEILDKYAIVQHDCRDEEGLTFVGMTHYGTAVWVNKLVMTSDRVFGIGHIDPSDFAGYAGGWKLVVPGVASLLTTNNNHSLTPLGFRLYGQTDLPCRLDIDEAGRLTRMHLLVNVVLCQDGELAGVFAGKPDLVFKAGVCKAREIYEVECPRSVDITVASAYPYDVDFYQSVRAIEYADLITRPGGAILLAAPCPDGMGSQEFFHLLAEHGKPADAFLGNMALCRGKVVYNALGYYLARIRAEKRIYGYLPGLTDNEQESIGLIPAGSVQGCLDRLLQIYEPHATMAVLPVGSATIPRLPMG